MARAFAAISWPVVVVLLLGSLCWIVSGHGWMLDLAANLTAQWLVLSAMGTLLWLVTRQRRLAVVGLVACASCVVALGLGRAAYWPRSRLIGHGPDAPADLVRLLHYNASAFGDGPSIEAYMRLTEADVLSIVCPPTAQQTRVVYGHHLEDEYPGKLTRRWRPGPTIDYTDITAGFMVSRWPLRAIDTSWLGDVSNYLIAGIVERPRVNGKGGEFAVIAFHPRSPRTSERWMFGNGVVESVGVLTNRLREQGLAVVVLSDLNATPTGYRSQRLFREANLRRAKPLFVLIGTYPNEVPVGMSAKTAPSFPAVWPASIAIDDALVTPGVKVVGWTVGPRMASGHLPIIVELDIPGHTVPEAASWTAEGAGAGR